MSDPQEPKETFLAILDDYPNIAPKHFTSIPNLSIISFPNTLSPSKPADLEKLIHRLAPFEIISSMRERTPFPRELLDRLPKLKLLLNSSARNAAIDLVCARERGVVVTGTKGLKPEDGKLVGEDLPPPPGASSVVQHAWALVLALCSRIPRDDAVLKSAGGKVQWQSGLMVSLAGKTLGIVGLGKLGAGMAKVGYLAWGMEVVCWSENLTQEKVDLAGEGCGVGTGVWRCVGREEVFKGADVVSLHLVLS